MKITRLKVVLFTLLTAVLAFASATSVEAQATRQTILLSGTGNTWNFFGAASTETLPQIGTAAFQQAPWTSVTIPHVFQTRDSVQSYNTLKQAWYYTTYTPPSNLAGKELYLVFEGAASVADVYVNNQHVGAQHRGGYTRFVIDVTGFLVTGASNQIAVQIDDNIPADAPDILPCVTGYDGLYKVWGGLYRNVWLMAVNPVHIDPTDYSSPGVYITPSNITTASAQLGVQVMLRNTTASNSTANIQALVLDPNGVTVTTLTANNFVISPGQSSVTLTGSVASPKLWAPGSPNLYHVQVNVIQNGTTVDSVTQPCGFRTVSVTGNTIILNGTQVTLFGASVHQETEYDASAMTQNEFISNFADMKDMGFSCVRFGHYPRAQIEYDLCDQDGLFCWTENGNSSGGDEATSTADFITTEFIKQNYNHPSIILWSVGNEASQAVADREVPVVQALDPIRPTGVANMTSNLALIHGNNAYPAWYGGASPWTSPNTGWVTEVGAGGVETTHYDYANAFGTTGRYSIGTFEPEEYQQTAAEAALQIVTQQHSSLAWFTWWNLRDFSDSKYRNDGNGEGLNTKGILTYAGDKKDIYYIFRCFYNPSVPTVHITSKRYFIRMGSATNGIKAYSNSPHLQLTLNGSVVSTLANGQFTQPGPHVVNNVFYWPVQMAAGKNIVKVQDDSGNTDSATIYFFGSGGSAALPDNPLITNVTTSNTANMAYVLEMPPQAQWPVYYDLDGNADNSFDVLPPEVNSTTNWIATRSLTRTGQQTNLSFKVNSASDVYVMATGTSGSGVPAFLGSGFQEVLHPDLQWRGHPLLLVGAQLFVHAAASGETINLGTVDRDAVVFVNPGLSGEAVTSPLSATGSITGSFTYQITASGNPTNFSATGLPAGLTINTSTGVITGNPTQLGTYNVTIGATNSLGTVMAHLTLTVLGPPAITSPLSALGNAGTAFTYQITGSSSPTNFTATGLPTGLSVNTSTGVISGTPSVTGTSNVTITATNPYGTGSATLVLTVQPAFPALAINCGSNNVVGSFLADNYFSGGTATTNAVTIDTSAVTYPAPQAVYQTNRYGAYTYTLSGFTVGTTYTIRLHFAETYLSTAGSRKFNVAINGTQVLANFDIFAASGAKNKANVQSFSLQPNANGQFIITTTNVVNNAQINGIEIDNSGNVSQPIITSPLTASGNVGIAFNYQITATNSPTRFNATGLPAGLTVNTTTGVVSGTPTAVGTSNVTLSTVNATGIASSTLVLSVSSAPATPAITSALTSSGTVGSAYTYQITASNSPTSFNASGLPAGVTVNTTTGVISGTPTTSGTSNVTISATNVSGTGTATLALSISSLPVTPVITSALTSSGTVGSAYTYQITASNSPTSFNATGLPGGLTVNTSTGVISGTPTTSGTSHVTISATNASGTGTATLALTVNVAITSTIAIDCGGAASGSFIADTDFTGGTATTTGNTIDTSAVTNPAPQAVYQSYRVGAATYTLPGFTSGTTYTVRLHFAETFWTHAGQRQFNVTINGTQVLTNFDIFASTGASNKANIQSFNLQPNTSGQFVITTTNVVDNALINGIEIYPAANATVPVITSAIAATGTAGFPLSYQITASNSPTSYSASGLPAGLSVNASTGAISGTPSASGTSNITLSATNASGTGTATLALTVQPYPSIAAINCGGAAAGNFIADTDFTGGTATTTGNTIDTSAVAIPAPQAVYQSNRYGAVTYTLPGFTVGTTYTVRLHFAETYFTSVGARTFNVAINGTQVLTNFDILATSGAINKANIQSFSMQPNSSGQFVITTTNVVNNAQINGIEIDAAQPVITSSLTASGAVGTAFSYQITASNTPTSYSATGLPAGLSVNTSTGVISGTPTTAATSNVTINATNASGTGSAVLVLTVNAGGGDTNVALGQSATASSFQAGNLVANANDGSLTTRWAASDGTFPQWWLVDLGANKSLSRCDIAWYGAASRAYKYKIEISTDNVSFTTVKDNTGNTTFGNTSDSFAATARYVRVTVTGSTSGFASAYEIAVFGH